LALGHSQRLTQIKKSDTKGGFSLPNKQIWRFCINVFCTIGAGSVVVMFLSLYLKTRQVGDVNIGGILGTYQIFMPLVILFFGLIADLVSCRRLAMLGSLVAAVCCFAMPLINNVYLLGLAVAISGIGFFLSFITVSVLFLKIVSEEKRGKNLSIFVASMTAGYAIGSAITSLLIRELPLPVESIFFVAASMYFVAFLAAIGLPEAPIERFPIIKYLHDTKSIPVLLIALTAFSVGTHGGAESVVLVRFMDEILVTRGLYMAAFFVLTGTTLSLFSRISGHLADSHGKIVKILIPGMLVSGLFQATTNWADTFPQFLIMRLLHTCGDGAIIFSVTMLISLVFTSARMGGNYGFNRTIKILGTAAGAAVSGFLVARYSLGIPFLASGVFQMGAACIIWMLRHHLPVAQVDHGRLKETVTAPSITVSSQ
jgi:DHA1 family multidrug resistance protein-like MFS transporter